MENVDNVFVEFAWGSEYYMNSTIPTFLVWILQGYHLQLLQLNLKIGLKDFPLIEELFRQIFLSTIIFKVNRFQGKLNICWRDLLE